MATTTTNATASPLPSPPLRAGEGDIVASTMAAGAGPLGSAAPGGSTFSAGSLAAGLVLAALAVAALVMARRRRGVARLVQVVETASLGPKRSLVVARLGDEILLLGSSEGGVSLLATRPAAALAHSVAPGLASGEGRAHSLAPGAAGGEGGEGAFATALAGVFSRVRRRPEPPRSPAFEALLAESYDDAELRRKLAAGHAGSVR